MKTWSLYQNSNPGIIEYKAVMQSTTEELLKAYQWPLLKSAINYVIILHLPTAISQNRIKRTVL